MPIALLNDLHPDYRLGLWRIEESVPWFEHGLLLDDAERAQLHLLKDSRKIEFLAVRQVLHILTGQEKRHPLQKDAWGKPFLPDSAYFVSLSHSNGMAAAMMAVQPVGIDIQHIVEKTERVVPKFMRIDEQASLSESFRLPHIHVYWSAKEALYKAYGRKQLDFCRHLFIEPFAYQPQGGMLRGYIHKEGSPPIFYDLQYLPREDYMLVWAIENRIP